MQVWAFDIDGTLIGAIRCDVLRPGVVDVFMAINAAGSRVVLWSAGGADYAQRMADNHGLTDHVHGYFEKPDRAGAQFYSVDHIPDAIRPTVFVDDSPSDLPPHWDVIAVEPFMGSNAHDRGMDCVVARLQSS